MKKQVAIIHFNTPELTEATILSLWKHGGEEYKVFVFDNSDERPFTRQMRNVAVFDNTKGQYIDFEKELEKYPEKDPKFGCAAGCWYGSDKHMMSVQKLWELLPDGFILMDSDILIKSSIDWMFMPDQCTVGYISYKSYGGHPRLAPMLLWINVPMCVAGGARFFDPDRAWALHQDHDRRNFWDTGAAFLDDIKRLKPQCHGKAIAREHLFSMMEHYGSGSWKKNGTEAHQKWLDEHRDLWHADVPSVAVCAIGRMENRYAVEWVEHYNSLGVDKIFIYDNNRIGDGELFSDVLQPYIEAGFVEIIYFDGVQREAYEDFYNNHANGFDWVGFFDFDEFVEFDDKDMDIPHFLQYKTSDAVVLNWREMTDNGLLMYDPRPVRERFTEGTGEDFQINHHTKFFMRTGKQGVAICDPHCPTRPQMVIVNARGEQVKQQPIQDGCIHNPARVDHYDTKTADEYINVKWKRGTCCGDKWTEEKRKGCVEYFFGINKRTPEKEAILGVVPPPSFDEAQGTPVVAISKPKTQKRKSNKSKK